MVFFDSNDGLAGCAPVPQTGVLMLVSTCLLYFPTTMTLLYVYGTVFHSHSSSQRLVPTTRSAVKAVSYQCNDHCTDGYCNVRSLLIIIIVITSETRFLASSPHKNEKNKTNEGESGRSRHQIGGDHVFGLHHQLDAVDHQANHRRLSRQRRTASLFLFVFLLLAVLAALCRYRCFG